MLQDKHLKELSRKMVAEPNDYMKSLRRNLQTYVDDKDITMHEIAEAADLSVDTVKTLIYGDSKDCKLSTIVALAKALKISVDELVGSGTISPVMCESIQITRNLPDNYVYFVRWCIRYHERMLKTKKASKKAINVMLAECTNNGNLRMNNNFELLDISDLSDSVRPKIFIGIKIPCDHYMPLLMEGDILLIANDRTPLATEYAVVVSSGNIWLVKRKEERDADGNRIFKYYNIRDGKFVSDEEDIEEVIGYVVKIVQ